MSAPQEEAPAPMDLYRGAPAPEAAPFSPNPDQGAGADQQRQEQGGLEETFEGSAATDGAGGSSWKGVPPQQSSSAVSAASLPPPGSEPLPGKVWPEGAAAPTRSSYMPLSR